MWATHTCEVCRWLPSASPSSIRPNVINREQKRMCYPEAWRGWVCRVQGTEPFIRKVPVHWSHSGKEPMLKVRALSTGNDLLRCLALNFPLSVPMEYGTKRNNFISFPTLMPVMVYPSHCSKAPLQVNCGSAFGLLSSLIQQLTDELLSVPHYSLGICVEWKWELAFGSIPEPLTYDLQHWFNDTKLNKQWDIF